ncbi:MAG: hypothetical protein IPK78_20050 [Rhodospirillales bacterium]|nr:hypothetical protein [Rhodospirillales bacterium]
MDVDLRLPDGADDILLLEAGPPDLGLALSLIARVVHRVDGAPLDPTALPIGDVDVLLLRLRQRVIGEVVSAEEVCAGPGCRARVDITFSIDAYLEHHRPGDAPPILPAEEGWYRLSDDAVEFRLPRAADQLAIARAEWPEQALLLRCLRPAEIADPARRKVEAAMEAMAPSLCAELEGICPECGARVEASFDPIQYTLRELRDQAAFVYEEVCAIAHHYHWSEAEILSLPAARRARYAELAAPRAAPERTTA